ncbi:MAG: DUF4262 domain-containing protein [Salinibacterium sp.]|nr:DUF4262 domain-containing protein [Salinibacterium sp.]
MVTANQELSQIIDKEGWAAVQVHETDQQPNYAYSVGLWKTFQHPEVIVFGLLPDVGHRLINVIGEGVREGTRFPSSGTSSEVLEGRDCAFREVSPGAIPAYMGEAQKYYGTVFPAIHCIWPDRDGRLPWQPGTSIEYRRQQPMLSDGPEPHTPVRPGD